MGNENAILEHQAMQSECCTLLSCEEEKKELRAKIEARDRTIAALVHERDIIKEQLGILRVNFGPIC